MSDPRTQISITSWEQLVTVASGFEAGPPLSQLFMYRGHANAGWKLHPSLVRFTEPAGLSVKDAIALEKTALQEYQGQAHK